MKDITHIERPDETSLTEVPEAMLVPMADTMRNEIRRLVRTNARLADLLDRSEL